jgi:hypothetical protein
MPGSRANASEPGHHPPGTGPAGRMSAARTVWTSLASLGGSRGGGSPRAAGGGRDQAGTWREDLAGTGLARLTVLPAILVVAWLLAGLPLLLAGAFLPVPVVLVAAPLAVLLVANGLRRVPGSWPQSQPGRQQANWFAWWGTAGTIAVAAGFAAWQFVENSPAIIVTRDPGAYLQTGYWIAQHGSLPIPQMLSAFGGAHHGLSFGSTGFFQHGTSVVPAFMSGLPMLLAGGFWVHGTSGAAALGPVLGGLAVLSFGGLVARLAGPQWAPAGALLLGLTLPQQYTSRSAFSETVIQVLLFGGLSLVIAALRVEGAGVRAPASAAARRSPAGAAQPETPASAGTTFPPAASTAAAGSAPATTADAPAGGHGGPAFGSGEQPDVRDQDQSAAAEPASQAAAGPAATARLEPVPSTARARGLGKALRPDPRALAGWFTPARVMAALGGLALGLTALASASAFIYLLAVIPFAGVLVAARRAVATAFCIGAVTGAGYGLVGGYVLARPFMDTLSVPMELTGLIAVWLAAVTIAVTQLLRLPRLRGYLRRVRTGRPLRWLPEAGAVVVAAALIGLAIRPYLQTVRGQTSHGALAFIAFLQRTQHLPLDPARQYAEDSLYWVIWYIGAPAVLLGGLGAALLVRKCLRSLLNWQDADGVARIWALPLLIGCGGTAAVLWDPSILPDQPWASRRLVPVVLPMMITCAAWAAGWLAGRARERGAQPATAAVVALFCVAALAVPTITTTFGIGLSHSGTAGGLRPTTGGMAFKPVNAGQLDAVRGLCASIGPQSSVIVVDQRVSREFLQVLRGMCAVPAASMAGQPAPAVLAALHGISFAGRQPVLLAARPRQLAGLGGSPARVLDLKTTQDPHTLTQPPAAPWPARYVIWMAVPSSASLGT